MGFFKKLFGPKKENKMPEIEFTDEQYEKDHELKSEGLENVLGKMHGMVGHAIIPFGVGGAVDMYYFPNHIQGTGFATMELLDPNGNGPKPNSEGTYELVAFTRHPYNADDKESAFNTIERHFCGIFTMIGNYAPAAVLKPGDTCELPLNEGEENKCVVFDNYQPGNKEFTIGDRKHHLLLCLEIFRSEMEFARANGSEELFNLLKEAGYYPYSDMDRQPVA